jgi:hypothetical protein
LVKTGLVNAAAAVGAVEIASFGPRVISAVNLGGHSALGTIRVTFDRPMAGATFKAGVVVVRGPDGERVPIVGVRPVAGSGGRGFDILLVKPQSRPGRYSLQVGPVMSALGERTAPFARYFDIHHSASRPHLVNAVNLGGPSALGTLRVSFNRPVPRSALTPADVVIVGPDGKRVPVKAVRQAVGYDGAVFDILLFGPRKERGAYTLTVRPNVSTPDAAAYRRKFNVDAPEMA